MSQQRTEGLIRRASLVQLPRLSSRQLAISGVCALALGLTACSSPSEVARFPNERQFMDTDVMAVIGLRQRRQARIDYNPRSPLVVPSAASLQTPKEDTDLGPQWPDDPDARAAAEQEAREEYQRTEAFKEDRTQALKPSELDDWARQSGMRSSDPDDRTAPGSEVRSVNILSPATLLGRRRAPVDPLAEPPRRRLTDPPDGYRRAVADENGQVAVPEDDMARAPTRERRSFLERMGF